MMTTKDEEFPRRDIKKKHGICERTCPRYRIKKKNISMLDKTETLGVCSPCGYQMPEQYDFLKYDNLAKTVRMSFAKSFDSDKRRINLQVAESNSFKTRSLENEKKDNLMLKISHSESYLHKADKKSEKSNEPDLTLPKLFDSQNKSLTSPRNLLPLGQLPFFQKRESPGNNNVYEPLPPIKKVHDKTSLNEKNKKTHDETLTFVFPTEIKQSKHRRRDSSTKLEQGKVKKGAEKTQKPQLQSKTSIENKEKFYSKPKLQDKSMPRNNSKIEDKDKLVNNANLDNKPKLKDTLSDKSKIEEKTTLGDTAEIVDEIKQQQQKPKLKDTLSDKSKIVEKTTLGDTPVIVDEIKKQQKKKYELNKMKNMGFRPSAPTDFLAEHDNVECRIKHNELKEKAKSSEFETQNGPIDRSPSLESHNDDSIITDNKENDDTNFIIISDKIFKYTKPKTIAGSLPQHHTETRKTTVSNTPTTSKKESHKREGSIKSVKKERKGVICFALSNPKFVDMGWTQLPTQKVVRNVNIYRMRPSQPEFDWFTKNKGKKHMHYDSGETLALFDDDGRGRWFYRNGNLALDYYNAEEYNANQRYVVYSREETDERGRSQPRTVLATFDHLGNGIIFDHGGKVRLKFDQNEGVVLDRSIGPESRWKWHDLNDPPVLQNVITDTQLPYKDPRITNIISKGEDHTAKKEVCKDMLALELKNLIRDTSKKMSQAYRPFQIRMKAFKINQHFSIRILDQATIYLIYRDGTRSIKLNIGMRLDPTEIVHTVSCDLGDIFNTLERFPAPTESVATMQRTVQQAKDAERTRVLREQRLRPLEPIASADVLLAGLSRRRQPATTHSLCPRYKHGAGRSSRSK